MLRHGVLVSWSSCFRFSLDICLRSSLGHIKTNASPQPTSCPTIDHTPLVVQHYSLLYSTQLIPRSSKDPKPDTTTQDAFSEDRQCELSNPRLARQHCLGRIVNGCLIPCVVERHLCVDERRTGPAPAVRGCLGPALVLCMVSSERALEPHSRRVLSELPPPARCLQHHLEREAVSPGQLRHYNCVWHSTLPCLVHLDTRISTFVGRGSALQTWVVVAFVIIENYGITSFGG